jgi:hypothetical protein
VNGAFVEALKSAGTDRRIEFDREFDHVKHRARMCFSMPSNLFVTDVMLVTIPALPGNKIV